MEIIVTTPEKLSSLIEETINKIEARKENEKSPGLFTINQVAKRLKRSHGTIKKLVESGIFKTTKDGLILEESIGEYLNK